MAGDNEQNTRFEYLYRDASNYKSWADLVFSGAITDELKARLSGALESGEFFIADQIRVPETFLSDWPLDQETVA